MFFSSKNNTFLKFPAFTAQIVARLVHGAPPASAAIEAPRASCCSSSRTPSTFRFGSRAAISPRRDVRSSQPDPSPLASTLPFYARGATARPRCVRAPRSCSWPSSSSPRFCLCTHCTTSRCPDHQHRPLRVWYSSRSGAHAATGRSRGCSSQHCPLTPSRTSPSSSRAATGQSRLHQLLRRKLGR